LSDAVLQTVRTTCPYCGVGCGVRARTDGQRLIAVDGDPDHPANRGRLCVKGTALPETQLPAGRLLQPELDGVRTTWDDALKRVADGFLDTLERHGPGSIAFYLSGQLLTEDYYVANKLMKGFLGSANVDTNSRLCMASAVAAYKRAFGEDVVPCDYDDLDACELVVLVGSNAAWTHPVLYQRIASRRATSRLKVVVIDPRRTASCDIADLHLPIRPGMDAALFNALLVHLHDRGALDRDFVSAHTAGLADALACAGHDALHVTKATGLSETAIGTFFDWFAETEKVVTFFSQGVNQAANGTDKANSIINVHLATGRIGRAGTGPFSITGQPNAMGGREVGGMATQLAAHRDFDPESVRRIGSFWGASRMATGPGLKAVDLFRAVESGQIRAIWIMGTNPVVSLPRAAAAASALARCPLVVISDCVADTETTRFANVLLPAQTWGEKNGTVTNSERCISRQRGFLAAAGEAKPDWWIVCEVARRMGFTAAFDYDSPASIFREHAALSGFEASPHQRFRLDAMADLTDADYDDLPPFRWAEKPFGSKRFPTPDGRARFVPIAPFEPVQKPPADGSLILNTGRLRDQWHTMTRTGLAPKLTSHVDAPLLTMHPEDAAARGFLSGDLVELHNGSGRIRALLDVKDSVPEGTTFFPIHWNGRFANPCRVNDLVQAVTDPVSGQPESKHATVRIDRVPVAEWVRCLGEPPADLPGKVFSTRLPSSAGWRVELALAERLHDTAVLVSSPAGCHRSSNLLQMTGPRDRRLLLEKAGLVVLAAAASADRAALPAWEALERAFLSRSVDWRLLDGSAGATPGKVVCTCFEVREEQILAAIDGGCADAEALGRALRCGTNCGSCLPELNSLTRSARTTRNASAV